MVVLVVVIVLEVKFICGICAISTFIGNVDVLEGVGVGVGVEVADAEAEPVGLCGALTVRVRVDWPLDCADTVAFKLTIGFAVP